jgi:hypothetical protein
MLVLFNQITNSMRRIRLKKLTVAQQVKIFSVFVGTQRFITVFTSFSPQQINPIYGLQPYIPKFRFNIIHLFTRVLRVVSFVKGVQPKFCMHFLCSLRMLHAPPILYPTNIWWSTNYEAPH